MEVRFGPLYGIFWILGTLITLSFMISHLYIEQEINIDPDSTGDWTMDIDEGEKVSWNWVSNMTLNFTLIEMPYGEPEGKVLTEIMREDKGQGKYEQDHTARLRFHYENPQGSRVRVELEIWHGSPWIYIIILAAIWSYPMYSMISHTEFYRKLIRI